VVCLAIAGKDKFDQHFIFSGDMSPFYDDGIKNKFQKDLFKQHGFKITDFCDYSIIGSILKRIMHAKYINKYEFIEEKKHFYRLILSFVINKFIKKAKKRIVKKILNQLRPTVLLTDQSIEDNDYIPAIFRRNALEKKISVFLFTHGAANGLHASFSNPVYGSKSIDVLGTYNLKDYRNCLVFACNKYENNISLNNRIILGDPCSSYPYVYMLNNNNMHSLSFLDGMKYKIGFFVGGTINQHSSTNAWSKMEEIIIEYSERKDVAMVLKLHPREAPFIDLRMLKEFSNLRIVNRETDRSRVTKWADILVLSDHCSAIFEPMVLAKKVVAIEGKHIPMYKNSHSPLKNSSVFHISSSEKFGLENIPNAEPEDTVTNNIAWGDNGSKDLADLIHKIIIKTIKE
jgi:hypothetical protein